jgi:hypothetical protein
MALQNSDLLPLYRLTDSSNRKITIANFKKDTQFRVPTVDNAPVDAINGDLYWDLDDATLYLYYDDGLNPNWVPATPVPESGGITGDIDGGLY